LCIEMSLVGECQEMEFDNLSVLCIEMSLVGECQ
jgi:hypothetical protein